MGTAEGINTRLLETLDLIVTTTGNTNVCDLHMMSAVKSGAVVCNIGHFDNEIDTADLREKFEWTEVKPQVHKIARDATNEDNYILLLSEGRLVNLGNATGHPSRIMAALSPTRSWLRCICMRINWSIPKPSLFT